MGFFLASVFAPVMLAAVLWFWLRAISGSRYFYVIWIFLASFVVGWLVIGFTIPIQHLLNPEQTKNLAGTALSMMLVLPAFFGLPMPLVAVFYAIPAMTILSLAICLGTRKQKEISPPHKLTLGAGILVLIILVSPMGWHVYMIEKLESDRNEWKSMGGLAIYRQGELMSLSFLPGSCPPWELLSKQNQLEYLSLRRCKVQNADMKHLRGCDKLRELHLDETDVTDCGGGEKTRFRRDAIREACHILEDVSYLHFVLYSGAGIGILTHFVWIKVPRRARFPGKKR